ncbi:peptide/nickel transport system substrate-binding protein [Tistlia consotensis]|uniref:Peptide/nickel transport system substrate-binding protein n=2 Tax=Tistlia TaxID=1321364 RepID=A0A1Y6BVX4_9PROT|nr:peptide/nickel transport system substrate-binding protein [Tistlia consotensis USBA 355]SNS19161.1 peptide/nickel transport system substrate-binding protein [Tistlia consotensis]
MTFIKVIGAVALSLVLLGTAGTVGAQTLTVGVRGGPESMDPDYSALGTHAEVAKHIFDTLVRADENLQIKPGLATSWKPIDAETWEFKLRKGVKFHDGSDFTAEDVKFSIARVPIVTGPTSTAVYVRRVKSVEIVDPYTVRIHTDGPAPALPYDFVRLFIVSAKAAKDYSTPETAAEGFNSGKATIGTGPFKFVSWEPKGDLVLERFDGYWGGAAPWKRVIRKEIPNDASRLAALKAGQVDLVNDVSSADYLQLAKDPQVDTFVGDSIYIMNLLLDQRPDVMPDVMPGVRAKDGSPLPKNPLTDRRVRQAFSMAIDRKTMVDVVLEGLGKPAKEGMPAGFFGFDSAVPDPVYDPAKAKALLAKAGYPDGFQIDLYCTSDRLPGDAAICQGLGQMLSVIGIDVNVRATSKTVYFPAQSRGEYSVSMNGWGTLTGEASYTLSSQMHTKDPGKGLGAYNRIHYSNPDLDALIERGSVELDENKRRAIFEKAMAMATADRVLIPIVQLQTVWAARKGMLTFTPRTDQDTLAYYIKPKG